MRSRSIEVRRETWPVRLMCRALGASTGGYPGRPRPPGARPRRRQAPAAEIRAIRREVKARYGRPPGHAGPVAPGRMCRASTVAELMRRRGIAARTGRKSLRTTASNHDRPVAGGPVERRRAPGAGDRPGAADITSIPAGEGRLYLAAVEGLHPRRVVGRSLGERIDSRPVVDAPARAIARRLPGAGPVAQPDRGSR